MLIFAGNVYNKHRNMLLTTTPAIEDHTIREYKGVVFGEHVRNLKAFIRLRDASPAFDPVKAERWTVRESLQYAQEPCPADLHSRTAG